MNVPNTRYINKVICRLSKAEVDLDQLRRFMSGLGVNKEQLEDLKDIKDKISKIDTLCWELKNDLWRLQNESKL